MNADRLVDDYLRRLEAAAAHLQRSRRTELVAEIREHIEAALAEEDTANEVAVRNVLERLGPPEEIVGEAEPPREATTPPSAKLEIAAIVALLVPFLGWLVGAVLVVLSRVWSPREKLVGLALLGAAILVPAFATMMASGGGEDEVPVGTPEVPATTGGVGAFDLMLVFVLGLPSALYLAWRLRRDRATEV